MIQEVVSREAELKLSVLRAAKGEILEHRQVGVEESRASQGRKDIVALLAWRSKRSKARAVDVLVLFEPCGGIARPFGHQCDVRGTKHVLAARPARRRKSPAPERRPCRGEGRGARNPSARRPPVRARRVL